MPSARDLGSDPGEIWARYQAAIRRLASDPPDLSRIDPRRGVGSLRTEQRGLSMMGRAPGCPTLVLDSRGPQRPRRSSPASAEVAGRRSRSSSRLAGQLVPPRVPSSRNGDPGAVLLDSASSSGPGTETERLPGSRRPPPWVSAWPVPDLWRCLRCSRHRAEHARASSPSTDPVLRHDRYDRERRPDSFTLPLVPAPSIPSGWRRPGSVEPRGSVGVPDVSTSRLYDHPRTSATAPIPGSPPARSRIPSEGTSMRRHLALGALALAIGAALNPARADDPKPPNSRSATPKPSPGPAAAPANIDLQELLSQRPQRREGAVRRARAASSATSAT